MPRPPDRAGAQPWKNAGVVRDNPGGRHRRSANRTGLATRRGRQRLDWTRRWPLQCRGYARMAGQEQAFKRRRGMAAPASTIRESTEDSREEHSDQSPANSKTVTGLQGCTGVIGEHSPTRGFALMRSYPCVV